MVPVIVTPIDFKEETWDKHLKATERKINTTFNKTMGTTPLEYLYGSTHTFEGASIVRIARGEHHKTPKNYKSKSQKNCRPSAANVKGLLRQTKICHNVGAVVSVKTASVTTGQLTKAQLNRMYY